SRRIQSATADHASVSPALPELMKLERDPRITSINILASGYWDSMWETVFLFHKTLYHQHPTYYPAAPLRGDWTLEDHADGILTVEPCHPGQSIRVNERFMAVAGLAQELSAAWDRGWEADERTHRWTADQVAAIRVHSRARQQIRIRLAYRALNAANH